MDLAGTTAAFPELSDIRPLVQSGQKEVYLALSNGQPVVLKLINPGKEDDGRVQREIAAVAKLKSPFVPMIFSHGTRSVGARTRYFIVEQFISGQSFRAYLQSWGRLPLDEVLHLLDVLLQACVEFEQHQLVHRDLKPENLMVDESGKLWVIDFGLVRMLDLESLTATGLNLVACTPGYGAPEQFRNRKTDINSRADLFAIGVIAYEALSGANPYHQNKRDALAVLRHVETQDLPRLSISGDGDGELASFLAALTSRFPSRRPQTAREALEWFRPISASLQRGPGVG